MARSNKPQKTREPREKPDWLARALARSGAVGPEEAEEAIRQGRVTIAGKVVRHPLAVLSPSDVVKVDGRPVALSPKTHVLMFHKPAGSVTSTVDKKREATVFDLLVPQLTPALANFRWHAVGRLDRDTTGLLFFTNDEKLLAHVTDPESKLPKRYVAKVYSDVTEEKIDPLRRGMQIDGERCRPAKVEILGPRELAVILTEGRFHQVKRMLGEVGLPTHGLHRERVGDIALDVPEGSWRELTETEIHEGLGFS